MLLTAFLLLCGAALQQGMAQQSDTTWDDQGLDPNGFRYDPEELYGHNSAGWFPQPYFGYTLMYSGPIGDVYDAASGVRPRGFHPTTEPFTWHNPYSSGERPILKPNDDAEEDDAPPTTGYHDYSLIFLVNLPFPAILRAGAGLQISEGLLFSNDTTRNYLLLNGARQQLKEVGVFYLKQYSAAASAGVVIPVYGAFLNNDILKLSSYYYLYAGYGLAYSLWNRGTQYAQIANAKKQIRYGNGTDTATLIDKRPVTGLNPLRRSIELGIGWNVMEARLAAFSFELFVSMPQSSVVDDAEWKQYFAGLRFSLGLHWIPEK